MSNSRKSSTNRLSSEEERKTVDAFAVQLQAHVARSSYLQSRLNSTLDSMDALRIRHRRELAVERETKERLKRKMDELVEYTAKVEEERDEMRECVAALIEKVEVTHDFSQWPHQQISLLEPLEPTGIKKSGIQKVPGTDTGTIAQYTTIIALLRSELENERVSHARTHDTAELEILTLRAQLARREAELEGCLVHSEAKHRGVVKKATESSDKVIRGKTMQVQHQQAHPPSLTPEEASQLLGLRTEKNRRLEAEIRQIASRLEQARAESAIPLTSVEVAHRAMAGGKEEGHLSVVIEDDNDTVVNPAPTNPEIKIPESPSLQPVVVLDMPSPFAMTPLRPASPLGIVTAAIRNSLKGAAKQGLPITDDAQSSPIQRFEEQVDRLAIEIDAFKVQRSGMSKLIAQQRRVQESPLESKEPPNEKLHSQQTADDDPVVQELRSEIARIKLAAAQREFELLAEIQRLQAAVEDTSNPRSLNIRFQPDQALAQSSAKRCGPLSEHTEDDGGEKSMDLATPRSEVAALESWIIEDDNALTVYGEHDLDASLIPLPPSPNDSIVKLPPSPLLRSSTIQERPPTPFSIVPPHQEVIELNERGAVPMQTSPTSDERLKALEVELANARQQVADRDLTLVELQHLINELRVQMRDAGLKIM